MFEKFKQVQLQLVAQRYEWIREGVTAGKLFITEGVVPDFKKHDHAGCDCKPDSVYWVLNAYDVYVDRHVS